MKPWARGRRFWNLYTQLGLRLSILLAYIIALSVLLRGSATLGATYILSYSMLAVSIVYNGGHVWRLYHLLAVERRPGQSKEDVGCVICLEVAAVIATSLVGFGILLVDTGNWDLTGCGTPECEERREVYRAQAEYAFYAACCLWAVAGLHFFSIVFVSIQCCVNKGLDRPQPAVNAARRRRAGNNLSYPPDNEQNRAEEDDGHELPAYRPPESTTSIVASRLSDEPPAYIERPSSPETTGPAAEQASNPHTR
ncbi:hypothetical protein QBC37DRAFT_387196 [Rhypophila decipiens]|uniref:Uncharacterized protein n=1 Tax=Rhypophila decipiens TaxID=261697 RepID=A0AAN6Y928_9PEZI|nr:hypothetical protein QBC37DRAFT_387196 [Rhypophila decipiens]